jgi:hypothetical protein
MTKNCLIQPKLGKDRWYLFRLDTQLVRFWLIPIAFCSTFGNSFFLAQSSLVAAENTLLLAQRLPPPPPIWTENKPKPKNKEYVFTRPKPNSTTLDSAHSYRVEVYGSSDVLLQQVRIIEPNAFRKGEIIQVGIFKQSLKAEELVRKLVKEGFWARIIAMK